MIMRGHITINGQRVEDLPLLPELFEPEHGDACLEKASVGKPFVCTLRPNHGGPVHLASNGVRVIAIWSVTS